MERFSTSLLGEAKTLLLATDGSHFSEGAIQEAIFFGQACRARVIVLHVVNTQAESIGAANFAVRQGWEELAPHFARIRTMAKDSGVEIEEVVVGSSKPERTIVEQARLREADVILMGRRGKSGRLALLVGKMTAKVIAQGFPRVLVAPKDFIITGTRILLAVNDSANSRRAAEEALSLGRTCTTLQGMTVMTVAGREEERASAQVLVDQFCERAQQEGLSISCDRLVAVGDPVGAIIEAAREQQADMILLGGPGRGSIAKLLKGHVTEQVIGQAHCAVLVVTA
jgi:nucleotide-binding universal stress UspA family protein